LFWNVSIGICKGFYFPKQYRNLNACSSQISSIHWSKINTQYHMIDAMENISSQKETANNKYVAQHIECPSKSQHVTKNLGQVGRAKCNIHRFLKIPSCTYSYISRSILEEDLDLLFFFSNPSKLMSSFSSFGGTCPFILYSSEEFLQP